MPTYMLAISPQKTSGWSWMSSGPGVTPWIINAASITAGTGPVGHARARAAAPGALAAALLADSGPATPSIAPLPKRSGCLESLRSRAYETKEEMTCADPGMMPMMKPSTVPRAIGAAESAQLRLRRQQLAQAGFRTPRGLAPPPAKPAGSRIRRRDPPPPERCRCRRRVPPRRRRSGKSAHRIDADHADQQSEHDHRQGLDDRPARQVAEHQQPAAAAGRNTPVART